MKKKSKPLNANTKIIYVRFMHAAYLMCTKLRNTQQIDECMTLKIN